MKKQNNFMKAFYPLLLVFFFAGVCSSGIKAQNDPEERVMFIQIKNLTPDDFQKVSQIFHNDAQLNIKQACVPAEVIMFTVPAGNQQSLDENFNRVRGAFMENTSLRDISILAEYSEQDFMERCKMFRAGEQNQ